MALIALMDLKHLSRFAVAALLITTVACGDDDTSSSDPDSSVSNSTSNTTMADAGMDTGGGDDTATDSGDDEDTAVADMDAPTFRDIRVSVSGEFGDEFDLNDADGELLLPVQVPVEVTVFGQDDTTSAEDLKTELIDDASGEVLPLEDANFRNGLWRLTALLGPGSVTRVRVTDEAGNAADSPAALRVPSLAETIVGEWKRPLFDLELQVIAQADLTVRDDGTWSQEESDITGLEGTWAVMDGDQITVEETMLPDVVSRARERLVSSLYVDAFYLSFAPYTRVSGDGEGAEGGWTHTEQRAAEEAGGEFGASREVTIELELSGDDTWTETVTIDGDATTSSGTWRIEINEDYIESLGDFLVREVEVLDGAPIAEAETRIELYDIRAGRLLRSPFVRDGE